MGRAPPAPPASLSRAPSFKTPSERVTSIALQTAAVAEVALPVPPPLPAPAPDETKEGGGAEAQGPGVAMHAGAVVRAALASSPSQALDAEAFMARLRQCACSMRRPEYSLKDFHADMEAQTPRPPPLLALISR